jgi:hypothetical protein
MPNVEIDRLTLDVPGLGPDQGRRLGEMIAARLAERRWAPPANKDHAQVAVTAPPGDASLEQLAGLIAAELQRHAG